MQFNNLNVFRPNKVPAIFAYFFMASVMLQAISISVGLTSLEIIIQKYAYLISIAGAAILSLYVGQRINETYRLRSIPKDIVTNSYIAYAAGLVILVIAFIAGTNKNQWSVVFTLLGVAGCGLGILRQSTIGIARLRSFQAYVEKRINGGLFDLSHLFSIPVSKAKRKGHTYFYVKQISHKSPQFFWAIVKCDNTNFVTVVMFSKAVTQPLEMFKTRIGETEYWLMPDGVALANLYDLPSFIDDEDLTLAKAAAR